MSLLFFFSFLLLFIGGGAIACSAFAALSCEFIGTKDAIVDDVFPPLTDSIGIFRYNTEDGTCFDYEQQFFDSSFNYYFLTSQLAAIVAPAFGTLALISVFCEIICCQTNFLLQNLLFLFAFLTQWSTFFIFGQTPFCFSENSIICQWKIGSILSIAAGGLYYICSILLCCLPRPTPCLSRRAVDNSQSVDDDHTFYANAQKEMYNDV